MAKAQASKGADTPERSRRRWRRRFDFAALALFVACVVSCWLSPQMRVPPGVIVSLYMGMLDVTWFEDAAAEEEWWGPEGPTWGSRGLGVYRSDSFTFGEFMGQAALPYKHQRVQFSGGGKFRNISASVWYVLVGYGVWRLWSLRPRYTAVGVCRRCGYPLESVPWEERDPTVCLCPECGARNKAVVRPGGKVG